MIFSTILISLLALRADPAPDQQQALVTMAPETARSRMVRAMDEATPAQDRLDSLQEIVERCEDAPIVTLAQYNLGWAQLEQASKEPGLRKSAIESLTNADRGAFDPLVQAGARFALGQAYYELAHADDEIPGQTPQADQTDLQARIDGLKAKIGKLRPAASAYRSVLDIDTGDTQAAANVERVRKEIKTIRDEIARLEEMLKQQQEQQKQQQQQQQGQQQDAADKLKELADQQQGQAQNSAENPPQDPEQAKEQKDEQQELCDQTESTSDDISKQQAQDQQKLDEVQKKINEARAAQERAKDAMDQGDQEQASKEQQAAADKLKEAAQSMQELADNTRQQGQEGEQSKSGDEGEEGEQRDKGNQSAQEEPSKNAEQDEGAEISEVARQLLDKERRERERRQVYRQTGQPTKVDKDW